MRFRCLKFRAKGVSSSRINKCLLFEGSGNAGGDGAEQALEFRLGRGGATVEAGPFIVERVDAVDEEHVQVDVERHPH